MSAYFLIDPRFDPYRIRASQERAEHLSRLTYLAIDRGERALRAVAGHLAGSVKSVIARLDRWRKDSTAEHALLRLDDRMLQDIGLSRDEVYAAVRSGHPRRLPESSGVPSVAPNIPHVPAGQPVEWRKAA